MDLTTAAFVDWIRKPSIRVSLTNGISIEFNEQQIAMESYELNNLILFGHLGKRRLITFCEIMS
jgi:hypothetical protein